MKSSRSDETFRLSIIDLTQNKQVHVIWRTRTVQMWCLFNIGFYFFSPKKSSSIFFHRIFNLAYIYFKRFVLINFVSTSIWLFEKKICKLLIYSALLYALIFVLHTITLNRVILMGKLIAFTFFFNSLWMFILYDIFTEK